MALNNLATELLHQRRWQEAESLAARAMAVDSGHRIPPLVAAQMGEGHYAAVDSTLDRFERSTAHNPALLHFRAAVAASRGDYAAARAVARQLQAERSGSVVWEALASASLAWLDEVQGHLAQEARDLDAFMTASEQRGLARDHLRGAVWRGSIDVRYRHRPLDGVQVVEAALRRHPLSSISTWDRPYPELARFYAEAGRPQLARRLFTEYTGLVPERTRRRHAAALAVPGAIAMAEGRVSDAIAAYRAWADAGGPPTRGLFELATAYDRAGQTDSALAIYERSVSTPGLQGTPRAADVGTAYATPATLRRLGELYEARGDRVKAREYYARFVDLRKDADPELQPIVADARADLKRLSGQPR